MSDQYKWIWPVAGTLAVIVAFGSGISIGDRWITLTFGPKAAVATNTSVSLDPAAFRPIVREEVQRGIQQILDAPKDAKPVKTVAGPPSLPSRAATLISTLHNLRSELLLYRTQHHDKYPTLEQLQDWAALTKPTNSDGSLAGGTVQVYGPYAQAAPVNPITSYSDLAPAGYPTPTCGWTYDERTGRVRAYIPYGHPGGEFVADAYVERGNLHRLNTVSVTR